MTNESDKECSDDENAACEQPESRRVKIISSNFISLYRIHRQAGPHDWPRFRMHFVSFIFINYYYSTLDLLSSGIYQHYCQPRLPSSSLHLNLFISPQFSALSYLIFIVSNYYICYQKKYESVLITIVSLISYVTIYLSILIFFRHLHSTMLLPTLCVSYIYIINVHQFTFTLIN